MPIHNIRLPSDSVGKRVAHDVELIINYDNGTQDFEKNDTVVFQTSGVTGNVVETVTGATGELHVLLDYDSATTVVNGENIQVDGVTYATAAGTGTLYYFPTMTLAGGHNTENRAEIDRYGGLHVRAQEGNFQLGPTGRLKTGQEIILGEYEFSRYTLPQTISTITSGGGTQASDSTYGANKYSVTTSAGDYVQRRTDIYHIVEPNYPVMYSTLLQHGDTGKSNHVRRWGYYDNNDGFYWQLSGTTLSVGYRSSNTGSVVDTTIAQSNWNGDRLDGNGGERNETEITIDVTKINYYWIAFSQSSCQVTWGVRIEERNIICHRYCWTNNQTRPPVKRWALPFTWEMENTGGTSGTSEMWVVYGQLVADTDKWEVYRNPRTFTVNGTATSGSWTPIVSVRVSQLDSLGMNNRTWIVPHKLNVLSSTEAIEYRVRTTLSSALVGATWAADSTQNTDIDTAATSAAGGIFLYSGFAGTGAAKVDEIISTGDLKPTSFKITRRANVTDTPYVLTFEAKAITAAAADVYVSLIQFELQET